MHFWCFSTVLKARFNLESAQVAPDLGEPGLPIKALAFAGANYLHAVLQRNAGQIVGIGHGRTLAAVVRHLPAMPSSEVKFVSLLGGLTRKFSASPFDVIHLIAERTGSEAYLMPVPLYANSAADRAVLLSQLGISAVFDLARQADLMLVGIGEARPSGSLVQVGMIRPDEVAELERVGVAGEMLGHFFDAGGNIVETELSGRSISLPPEDLRGRNIVAIAGGPGKVAAIRAALASGLLKGLITDELTARCLVTDDPGVMDDKKLGRQHDRQKHRQPEGMFEPQLLPARPNIPPDQKRRHSEFRCTVCLPVVQCLLRVHITRVRRMRVQSHMPFDDLDGPR